MKKIGIGYENYKEFIDEGLYFVDKTLLIRDIVEKGGKVTLFTRPRRFGKTLALSMLRTFFEREIGRDGQIADNRHYFQGMKIMDCGKDILSRMGQYPVIKLSLKSSKQKNFNDAFYMLREEIKNEFRRHDYLRDSKALNEQERQMYLEFAWGKTIYCEGAGENEIRMMYANAIKALSTLLKKHHDSNVIILLDEYDVPLENAWFAGFYDEMADFIRSLFEASLKTNESLEFAAVTGCLRISRESIFSGLNHLEVNTINSLDFGEYFGFTQDEVEVMLSVFGLMEKREEVRDWYDGYLFCEREVYNPWSVLKYVKDHSVNSGWYPRPYWANTSSNSVIKDMVERADEDVRDELALLIDGGTLEKKIHDDITYGDIYESEDNLWNFLYFTGYMRKVSERLEGEDIFLKMRIPNREVKRIYTDQIMEWFNHRVRTVDRTRLFNAIEQGDAETISDYLSELLEMTISTFDSAESFYHGFFLSLLSGFPRYRVKSNREEGIGRPDIVLYPKRAKDQVYLFELKVRKEFERMKDGLEEAIRQIHEKRYREGILSDGYTGVVAFGVCFCKESCIVGKITDTIYT